MVMMQSRTARAVVSPTTAWPHICKTLSWVLPRRWRCCHALAAHGARRPSIDSLRVFALLHH